MSVIQTQLDDCGCCQGESASVPKKIDNRPGLETINYRIGDYHSFKDSMLARLSSSDLPELKGLTTRDDNDFTIGLIDAWSVVSEVLCFYQEYYANERWLRTAKERFSILEQARLIGYQLHPGVAASTYIAFTMDKPLAGVENPVLQTTIARGARVQSTPGPDESPQLFETEHDITARVSWNALRPRLTQPQTISSSMQSVMINGISTFVKPGDELLLIHNNGNRYVKKVTAVVSDNDASTTQLQLSGSHVSPTTFSMPLLPVGEFSDLEDEAVLTPAVINTLLNHSWSIDDIVAAAEIKRWDLDEISQKINTHSSVTATVNGNGSVHGFHKRVNVFGYNAAKKVQYSDGVPKDISQWAEWSKDTSEDEHTIFLDNAYSEVLPGSYLILHSPSLIDPVWVPSHGHYHYPTVPPATTALAIDDVKVIARTAYGLSSKSTKITLANSDPWWDYSGNVMDLVREASILIQSEALDLTQVPLDELVSGDEILLDHADLYLRSGQYICVSGELADGSGLSASEVLAIEEVRLEGGFTLLKLATSLSADYLRHTVSINANVALASHGESTSDILGSGDASLANQTFNLKQSPLTYISAANANGAQSSLEVRVNDVLWHEVESFLGYGRDEKIYTTKIDDEGLVTIAFGDGIEGARLPSGNHNIIAKYRKGIGLGGNVKARQINLLMTRPLGLKEAINPVASSGGDDPESLSDARSNAPLNLLTLGRTVSLSDYADYARSFAGVEKAQAIALSHNGAQSILVTVAGPEGALIETTSKTYENLLAALQGAGDPYTKFSIVTYRPAYFRIAAGLFVNSDYDSVLVLAVAKQALRDAFSFESRQFSQPVYLSEVISIIQAVDGVIAVDVNELYRTDGIANSLNTQLLAKSAVRQADLTLLGAELLTLDSAPLDGLEVIA